MMKSDNVLSKNRSSKENLILYLDSFLFFLLLKYYTDMSLADFVKL